MSRRGRRTTSAPAGLRESSLIDEALDALGADALRGLIRDILPWLDEKNHSRLANELIDLAARGEGEWVPAGPSQEGVSEIVAYAEAATRVGYADPDQVDRYLREGTNAFLSKDYPVALEVFEALLPPICEAKIDLGQHELVDEVLGVDVSSCATQYVVATYITTAPKLRAEAVRDAIADVHGVGYFWEPIREMEGVAITPLPELEDFLPRWRTLCESNAAGAHRADWDNEDARWLREVVLRLEGADGLARVARASKRTEDLRAWCRELVAARDWKAAFSAYKEAAQLVLGGSHHRGDFLDGAALAAQELQRKDLPDHLKRAWEQDPRLPRLQRWLGSSGSKAVSRRRAGRALGSCPKEAHRQRALLHVLLQEYESAARLLAAGPGLGWSDREHPGHLLFPLFCRLLGTAAPSLADDADWHLRRRGYVDALTTSGSVTGREAPILATPTVDELMELGGISSLRSASDRSAVIRSLRAAAEKRVAGVTEHKRRRYYGHAASLVAACAAVDPTPEATRWLTSIRTAYRRYPALKHELEQRGC